MVKLFGLCILYKGQNSAIWLKSAYDLQSFGYFQRNSVEEFMAFTSKTIVERTQNASRQSVKQGDYFCHAYVQGNGLSGVVISSQDYPHRVAHSLLTKLLDEFSDKFPASSWPSANQSTLNFPEINKYLAKYQNPKEADAMTKIQEDLDETTIILHNTIEAVLQRGEKLDDLVAKSEGLSTQSKAFYKTAKRTNSCCNLG